MKATDATAGAAMKAAATERVIMTEDAAVVTETMRADAAERVTDITTADAAANVTNNRSSHVACTGIRLSSPARTV